ncbi:hypothetical protein V1478_010029 [Vespula squamosa]|uniref:Uncharacterized protein n=1 Tax=Vespula squamosa TaxID=30214 RepID=A0ABD2AK48_VESSQ
MCKTDRRYYLQKTAYFTSAYHILIFRHFHIIDRKITSTRESNYTDDLYLNIKLLDDTRNSSSGKSLKNCTKALWISLAN